MKFCKCKNFKHNSKHKSIPNIYQRKEEWGCELRVCCEVWRKSLLAFLRDTLCEFVYVYIHLYASFFIIFFKRGTGISWECTKKSSTGESINFPSMSPQSHFTKINLWFFQLWRGKSCLFARSSDVSLIFWCFNLTKP